MNRVPVYIVVLMFALTAFSQQTMKVGGLIVEKEAIDERGRPNGFNELYLRLSVDDYFIKLCEGNVTKKQLEPYIEKAIAVEVEIREGAWDICPGGPQEMASRIGKYVVIHRIIEN